jgi:phosphoglycerate kinase
LLRADLNVPFAHGVVTDTARLTRLLPTLTELRRAGAKTIILSHFGRPDGKPKPEASLRPIADKLADLLGLPIAFAEDCVGPKAEEAVASLKNGDFLVLENTRFHPGEEANDPAFVDQLAQLGDLYVNDAFSAAHRAHASTEGLAHRLPAVAGRLMEEELSALAKVLEHPERPVAALIGGSKISTKLALLENLIAKVDVLILGGGMANTFLAAKGVQVGASLIEPDQLETARTIMKKADAKGCLILLPPDVAVADKLAEGQQAVLVPIEAIPSSGMILDIGPRTVAEIKGNLEQCRTVLWNGPLGVFETPPFDQGTTAVAIAVADLTKRGHLLSVAGGGDTVSALAHAGVSHDMSYVSTAGGAFLEWLEGRTLPGVKALVDAAAHTPV